VAAAGRQHSLAVSLLAGEHALALLDGVDAGTGGGFAAVSAESQAALDQVPHAAQWARRFVDQVGHPTPKAIQQHAAPAAVRIAVVGIATACVSDPDRRLRDLLATTIADFPTWTASRRDPRRPSPAVPVGR
jgi:hypothetical protein